MQKRGGFGSLRYAKLGHSFQLRPDTHAVWFAKLGCNLFELRLDMNVARFRCMLERSSCRSPGCAAGSCIAERGSCGCLSELLGIEGRELIHPGLDVASPGV